MRSITPELTPELLDHFKDANKVAATTPYLVNTFRELVEHTAKLAYLNKDNLLFFRGQNNDYRNKAGSSSFYPNIYRGDYLLTRELINRFDILDGASKALVNLFEDKKIEGYRDLKKRKSIQWSILQHYEVCATPYLDFTQSLRVACSFAVLDNKEDYGYIFVFGLPYCTNRISINSEHDIINIRLLSICPPTALRPYFQEGYLVGTDDITTNYDAKNDLDFNRRLIAKFQFPKNQSFWGEEFDPIIEDSLYPKPDTIENLCKDIKDFVSRELRTGDIGEFLKTWATLEELLIENAPNETKRFLSVREAVRLLYENNLISKEQLLVVDRLRIFRNVLVHSPKRLSSPELQDYLGSLEELLKDLSQKLKQ